MHGWMNKWLFLTILLLEHLFSWSNTQLNRDKWAKTPSDLEADSRRSAILRRAMFGARICFFQNIRSCCKLALADNDAHCGLEHGPGHRTLSRTNRRHHVSVHPLPCQIKSFSPGCFLREWEGERYLGNNAMTNNFTAKIRWLYAYWAKQNLFSPYRCVQEDYAIYHFWLRFSVCCCRTQEAANCQTSTNVQSCMKQISQLYLIWKKN